MESRTLLTVSGLKTYYYTRNGVVRAVDDVSFEIGVGETLGLVGESGCGKTTLGYSILRLIPPPGKIVGGSIFFRGEDLRLKTEREMRAMRGRRISMVFQDATTALDPLATVGDQIAESIVAHEGVNHENGLKRARDAMQELGIPPGRANDYPHQFSGGMRQRIMIAIALCLRPELIVADEITTALDPILQGQILELLKELARGEKETAWILVTHSLGVVAEVCDRAIIMYAGKIVETADVKSLFVRPMHPYTQGLIQSVPRLDIWGKSLTSIAGSPPPLHSPPSGCRFHPRCPCATKICSQREPPLLEVQPGHWVSCFLYHGGSSDAQDPS